MSIHFPTNSADISHNVLAVYDVLAARISKPKSQKYNSCPAFWFAGAQNLAEWGVGTSPQGDWPSRTEPEPPKGRRSVNRPVMCGFFFARLTWRANGHSLILYPHKYIFYLFFSQYYCCFISITIAFFLFLAI